MREENTRKMKEWKKMWSNKKTKVNTQLKKSHKKTMRLLMKEFLKKKKFRNLKLNKLKMGNKFKRVNLLKSLLNKLESNWSNNQLNN